METLHEDEARVLNVAVAMELFKRDHGREASTAAELREWSAEKTTGVHVEPSSVLSPAQIAAVIFDCRRRR